MTGELDRATWNQACADIRMDAYYYGFDGTGERSVDLILSSVATAGKMFHHTEWWDDHDELSDGGGTVAERIQRAADEAAAEVRRLRAQRDAVLALHHIAPWNLLFCAECETNGMPTQWPCPTARALGVES